MSNLKNIPDFENIYETIQPRLAPLEVERKLTNAKFKRMLLVITTSLALFAIGIFLTFIYKNPVILFICLFVGIISSSIAGFKYHTSKQKFYEKVKGGLIVDIIGLVKPDLKYEPWDSIPGKEFINTKLFNKRVGRFSGEDYLEGYMNGFHFRLTEIKLEQNRSRDGEGYSTFFKGLLIAIEKPHLSNGHVKIVRKKNSSALLDFFSMFDKSDLTEVETTNQQFNKQYKLSTDSNKLVNQIITDELLGAIFNMNSEITANGVNENITEIAYINKIEYIVIDHKQDLFSPNHNTSLTDAKSVKQYYSDLQYALELVHLFSKP